MNLLSQPVARSSFITDAETDVEDYLRSLVQLNKEGKDRAAP
jgi:hypothetical protein